ncbi:MAG: FAD-binding oxidoreductase [Planctomycetota bacterium]|jgi:FAD/FMN-containing dehydrogenase
MDALARKANDALGPALRGQILLPGSEGYEQSRTIWNAMIDRRPAVVARCVGTADVIACVDFVREHGAPFTVRGGGHNIAGLAVSDGSLMIDLSHMRGAWVDREAGTVHAQPGATLGDIDRETQLHGQAAVLGFVSNTGATGLTLGGGFGYLTRRYGWTCDNLRSISLVTATGELVRASEDAHQDLFWALRGGGGNFGVVTDIEFRTYPVGPEITGGIIAWRGEDIPGVLEMYGEIVANAPPELTCACLIRKAPPAPWLPEAMHGQLIIGLVACHTGAPDQADRDLARIKGFGSPVGDVVVRRPYAQQQTLLDTSQPNGRRYYWKSEYLPGPSADMLEVYRRHGEAVTSPHSAAILFPVDGALNDLPAGHSPMGNRDAKLVLNLTASWEHAEEDDVHIGWARAAWNEMKAFSTGGTYVNFLNAEDGEDRIRDAYGGHYDRLVEAKTTWDPENLFRANKNIAPKTGASR